MDTDRYTLSCFLWSGETCLSKQCNVVFSRTIISNCCISNHICFSNPYLHNLLGAIWTAFTDLRLGPKLL